MNVVVVSGYKISRANCQLTMHFYCADWDVLSGNADRATQLTPHNFNLNTFQIYN